MRVEKGAASVAGVALVVVGALLVVGGSLFVVGVVHVRDLPLLSGLSLASQPALAASLSGTQELILPPCDSQTTHDCTVNSTWTGTLLSPSAAGAWYVDVFGMTGSFTTCSMIAVWETSVTSSSVLPQTSWGGSADFTFYNGHQYMSTEVPGYPGTGITPYVHYSTADGCGTYDGPPPKTTTTASTTGSSSSSATRTTAQASVSTSVSTEELRPYGGRLPGAWLDQIVGWASLFAGVVAVAGGSILTRKGTPARAPRRQQGRR